jgi:hypothetical protein
MTTRVRREACFGHGRISPGKATRARAECVILLLAAGYKPLHLASPACSPANVAAAGFSHKGAPYVVSTPTLPNHRTEEWQCSLVWRSYLRDLPDSTVSFDTSTSWVESNRHYLRCPASILTAGHVIKPINAGSTTSLSQRRWECRGAAGWTPYPAHVAHLMRTTGGLDRPGRRKGARRAR